MSRCLLWNVNRIREFDPRLTINHAHLSESKVQCDISGPSRFPPRKQIITRNNYQKNIELAYYHLQFHSFLHLFFWLTKHFTNAIVTMETTLVASNPASEGQRVLQAATYRSNICTIQRERLWKKNNEFRSVWKRENVWTSEACRPGKGEELLSQTIATVPRATTRGRCLTIGQRVDDGGVESVSSSQSIKETFRRKSVRMNDPAIRT